MEPTPREVVQRLIAGVPARAWGALPDLYAVVVAEFDYAARNTATGATITVANVFVVRVRHGLIVHSRDYSNQVLFAAAFLGGQLQAEFG